jgi:HTH-type transcriptional regulator / antitoxin HipB
MNNEQSKLIDMPKDYYAIHIPKRNISKTIRDLLKEQNLTYRQACEKIEDLNYTQFTRVTSGANYTIETLLKTLDGLGLEMEIKRKNSV